MTMSNISPLWTCVHFCCAFALLPTIKYICKNMWDSLGSGKNRPSNDNTSPGFYVFKNPMSVIFLSAPKDVIWKAELYFRFLLKFFASGVFCENRFLSKSGVSCIVGRWFCILCNIVQWFCRPLLFSTMFTNVVTFPRLLLRDHSLIFCRDDTKKHS